MQCNWSGQKQTGRLLVRARSTNWCERPFLPFNYGVACLMYASWLFCCLPS
jgi:hypothetical protein